MFAASTKCSLINKVAEIVTSVYKLSVADPGEGLGVGRKGGAGGGVRGGGGGGGGWGGRGPPPPPLIFRPK